MKKITAILLALTMLFTASAFTVYAEELASTVYTIDQSTKTISGVAPLTDVAAFLANLTGGSDLAVVNVDGTQMTAGYATENVFLKSGDELYSIKTKALYQPLEDKGAALSDGTAIFNYPGTVTNPTVLTSNAGFNRIQIFGKIGTGGDNPAPANTDAQTVKAVKQTENGKAVYSIENDSNNYVYLRSHASTAATALETATRDGANVNTRVVTTVSFEADKLGNISLFHNYSNKTDSTYDRSPEDFFDSKFYPYLPSAVQFTEDGKIKIGGIYSNFDVAQRTPINEVGTWEANKKYTVSVVQNTKYYSKSVVVEGVYVNGVKVFPKSGCQTNGTVMAFNSASETYTMTSWKSSSQKIFNGGISSIMFGTAPKTSGENFTVKLSDVSVYKPAAFDAAVDGADIKLDSVGDITVNETTGIITGCDNLTAGEVTSAFGDTYKLGIYKDGALVAANEKIDNDMSIKAATADGLKGVNYGFFVQDSKPVSSVYTVDNENMTVSGVAPLTTVAQFLANFTNGSLLHVVNVDDSVMDSAAYATENVYLKSDFGKYRINISYKYNPIHDNGEALSDGTELYDYKANEMAAVPQGLTDGGFSRLETYGKLGTGSDNPAPANTDTQTVKAVKQSQNGKAIYVMENDSSNYAYIRSHYTASTNYSTTLRNSTFVSGPVVTTMSFSADKYGTISLFHNVPSTALGAYSGDQGIDRIIYGSDNPYVANAVHFMEDGKIMLGGIYSAYPSSYRQPVHDTNVTWEPGKTYTVSVVQRMYNKNSRYGYVEGVYINGVKVFPFENAANSSTRFAYQTTGTYAGMYAMTSRSNDYTYGGGISSVMIGTAPKTDGENLTVKLSDMKVYTPNSYNENVDKKPAITAKSGSDISVGDTSISNCTGLTVNQLKAQLDGTDGYKVAVLNKSGEIVADSSNVGASMMVEIVSEDGLTKKEYTVKNNNIDSELILDGTTYMLTADFGDVTDFDNTTPVVFLAVYDKTTNELVACSREAKLKSTGTATSYEVLVDLEENGINAANVYAKGFVFGNMSSIKPIRAIINEE